MGTLVDFNVGSDVGKPKTQLLILIFYSLKAMNASYLSEIPSERQLASQLVQRLDMMTVDKLGRTMAYSTGILLVDGWAWEWDKL